MITQEVVQIALNARERAKSLHWLDLRFRDEAKHSTMKDALEFLVSLNDKQIETVGLLIQEFAGADENRFEQFTRSLRGLQYDFLMEDYLTEIQTELRERCNDFTPEEDKLCEEFLEPYFELDIADMENIQKHLNQKNGETPINDQIIKMMERYEVLPAKLKDYICDYVEISVRWNIFDSEQVGRAREKLLAMPKGLRSNYWQATEQLNHELKI